MVWMYFIALPAEFQLQWTRRKGAHQWGKNGSTDAGAHSGQQQSGLGAWPGGILVCRETPLCLLQYLTQRQVRIMISNFPHFKVLKLSSIFNFSSLYSIISLRCCVWYEVQGVDVSFFPYSFHNGAPNGTTGLPKLEVSDLLKMNFTTKEILPQVILDQM